MSGEPILDPIRDFLRRYVVFVSDDQVLALALWVIHTHAFEAADATPYPMITSPEKRSGKSRLLEALEMIVANGWLVAGVSEAVLYRKIAQTVPTLLLDEVDAIFGTFAEKTEPIRGVINAGNRRGGAIARCVGPNHDVENFPVFCPKCLAGIDNGSLPDTIRDRAIPIGLHRKANEPIERFRIKRAREQAKAIVEEIETWVDLNFDALNEAEPVLPDELDDRAAEGWEPLLAIADALGDEVADRARRAALFLSAEEDIEDLTFGSQLLADIREVWTDDHGHNLTSEEICTHLCALEDRPWRAWGRGRPSPGFTPRDLARMLRPYGPRPKTVRLGGEVTKKGYSLDQFVDAWRRYLPTAGEEERG